jgi:hypothetical protein
MGLVRSASSMAQQARATREMLSGHGNSIGEQTEKIISCNPLRSLISRLGNTNSLFKRCTSLP